MLLVVEAVLSIGRISEDEEDWDEMEGERPSGVPPVEEEADSGPSRLLFNFLKCSSRLCISFASIISDGGGGRLTWDNKSSVDLLSGASSFGSGGIWSCCVSFCSFGRAANPTPVLDYAKI